LQIHYVVVSSPSIVDAVTSISDKQRKAIIGKQLTCVFATFIEKCLEALKLVDVCPYVITFDRCFTDCVQRMTTTKVEKEEESEEDDVVEEEEAPMEEVCQKNVGFHQPLTQGPLPIPTPIVAKPVLPITQYKFVDETREIKKRRRRRRMQLHSLVVVPIRVAKTTITTTTTVVDNEHKMQQRQALDDKDREVISMLLSLKSDIIKKR
jgi:hypothetical protein